MIFKSVAGVKTMAPPGTDELQYLCLSRGNFELLLRELLLVQNYRVEVYTKSTRSDWSVEYKASPGNLTAFESLLFQSNEVVSGTSIIGLFLKTEGARRVSGKQSTTHHTHSTYVLHLYVTRRSALPASSSTSA